MGKLNLHWSALRLIAAGKTQSGKTTFAERFVKNAGKKYSRIFIFDWYQQEFSQRLGIPAYTETEEVWKAWFERNERIIIYDPSQEFLGDWKQALALCAHFVHCANDNLDHSVLFVIDELNRIYLHNNERIEPEVLELWAADRKKQIDILFTTHQINKVAEVFRSSISHIACFCQRDRNAIKWFNDCDIVLPDDVMYFGPGEYFFIDYNATTFERHSLFENRLSKRVDKNQEAVQVDNELSIKEREKTNNEIPDKIRHRGSDGTRSHLAPG